MKKSYLSFQILTGTNDGWKLVTIDDNKHGKTTSKHLFMVWHCLHFLLLL